MLTQDEENELIKRAKSGDCEALNLIIKDHIGWCKSKIRECRRYGVDSDDVFSFALESVWRAVTRDKAGHTKIKWFAWTILKRMLLDSVKARRRKKRSCTPILVDPRKLGKARKFTSLLFVKAFE